MRQNMHNKTKYTLNRKILILSPNSILNNICGMLTRIMTMDRDSNSCKDLAGFIIYIILRKDRRGTDRRQSIQET